MNSSILRQLALLAAGLGLASVATGQTSPGLLDGEWHATYSDQKGATRTTGVVTLAGGRGTWVDTAAREKRCDAIAGPVTLGMLDSGKITLTVERSQAQGQCDDRAFVMRREGPHALVSSFREAPLRLSRTAELGAGVASAAPVKVQMFYFGGNDCPPCVAWRGTELPRLQAMSPFRAVEFVYVTKSIMSGIPAAAFLPESVRPYKARLDAANAGAPGSPQTILLVNGEVFDIYWGARSAEDIAMRLAAIQAGGRYPMERCLELSNGNQRGMCARRISPQ